MNVCAPFVYLVAIQVRRGCWIPGAGGIDNYEPSYGCRETNWHPLQVQQVLLTREGPREPFLF